MTSNNLQKITIKQKIILNSTVFALSCVAIFYFVIIHYLDSINELKDKVIVQKVEIEKNIRNEQNRAVLTGKLSKIEPELYKLDSIFINKNRELEFITTLEGLANETGVSQKIAFTPPVQAANNKYNETPLDITLQGQFNNVLKYLSSLETLAYYVNVKSLSFSSQGSRGGSDLVPEISAKISAFTYWK